MSNCRSDCCLLLPNSHASRMSVQRCPAGSAQPQAGSASCELCQAGTYSAAGSATCLDCPLGTFASTANTTKCTVSARGKRCVRECQSALCVDGPPSTSHVLPFYRTITRMQACAAGSYTSLTAQTSCTLCPPGNFSSTSGAKSCPVRARGGERSWQRLGKRTCIFICSPAPGTTQHDAHPPGAGLPRGHVCAV